MSVSTWLTTIRVQVFKSSLVMQIISLSVLAAFIGPVKMAVLRLRRGKRGF